jgi:ferric-dicitrate binding protein FerR (iron transport regulator)
MVAASISMAAAAAVWMYASRPQEQAMASAENVYRGKDFIHLPDGTTVMLNDGAEISINFNEKERTVTLSGEAYFDVYHDVRKPFYVKSATSSLRTRVYGTTFTVAILPIKNIVSVSSGKVGVTDKDNDFGILLANEALEVNFETKEVKKIKATESHSVTQWQDSFFVLDAVTMDKAALLMEKRFNKKIVFTNKAVEDCVINAKFFGNEEPAVVLDMLAGALNITWSIDEKTNTITIDGKGCN